MGAMHIRLGSVRRAEETWKRAPKWQHIPHNSHKIYHVMNLWWNGTSLPSSSTAVFFFFIFSSSGSFLRFSRTVSSLIPCILLTISFRLISFFSVVCVVTCGCWSVGVCVCFSVDQRNERSRAYRVLDAFSHIMWQIYGEARPYNIRDTLCTLTYFYLHISCRRERECIYVCVCLFRTEGVPTGSTTLRSIQRSSAGKFYMQQQKIWFVCAIFNRVRVPALAC